MSSESKVAAAAPSDRPAVEVCRHGMSRRQAWVTAAMAVLILIPSMYGFIGKFVEFVHIYRGTGGGDFAVAPILNYLLASAGFFCMLLWAAWNGLFRDIEKPKVDFLDNEARLDGGRVHALFPHR